MSEPTGWSLTDEVSLPVYTHASENAFPAMFLKELWFSAEGGHDRIEKVEIHRTFSHYIHVVVTLKDESQVEFLLDVAESVRQLMSFIPIEGSS